MQPLAVLPASEQSEDCLHLNVYTPAAAGPGSLLPVLQWLHGGGLMGGSIAEAYNASGLVAREDVVVVMGNYRVGVFGFGAAASGREQLQTNFGFLDQREALRWTQRNVAAFGGDAERVTIFGQSAGGLSVSVHFLSPGSRGLFHRAIFESGDTQAQFSLDTASGLTDGAAKLVGCEGGHDLACLGSADAHELIEHYLAGMRETLGYSNQGAVLDHDVVVGPPVEVARRLGGETVPLIIGSNSDESNIFLPWATTRPATASEFECAIRQVFNASQAKAVLEMYAPVDSPGVDHRNRLSELITDFEFSCENRQLALALGKAGRPPYAYIFKRWTGTAPLGPNGTGIPVAGAVHSAEVPYVFSNGQLALALCESGQARKGDCELAARMGHLWATFAREGHVESWPRFDADEIKVKFDLGGGQRLETESGYRRGQCEFLEEMKFDFAPRVDEPLAQGLVLCQNASFSSVVV